MTMMRQLTSLSICQCQDSRELRNFASDPSQYSAVDGDHDGDGDNDDDDDDDDGDDEHRSQLIGQI